MALLHDTRPPTVTREVGATAEQVWDALRDGWTFSTWVVGTSRIRAVDAAWPEVGTCIHHSFGLWPALVNETTRVEGSSSDQLVLRAHGGPFGWAHVTLGVAPRGERCVVSLTEDAGGGPAARVPAMVRRPVIRARNRESLRRLADLVERRTEPE